MNLHNNLRFRRWALFVCVAFFAGISTATAGSNEQTTTKKTALSNASKPSVSVVKQDKKKEKYLRLQHDKRNRPIAMEVAIVRFEPTKQGKKSPVVDLIGAVHIADPDYFTKLNKRFADYDAVLYELVAPEGTRPKQDAKGGSNPISTIQIALTDLLNLQFQLQGINYQASNMVHADMSPEEFKQSMRDRGETPWSLLFRMLSHAMLQQGKKPSGTSDVELLMALLNKNRALALKRIMAKQFQDLDGMILAIDGPKGSTLISHRNAKALDVLRRELKSGKRKIAIFYGAGHLPDMAKRLNKDFGFKATDKQWLQAWDMTGPKAKTDKASHK